MSSCPRWNQQFQIQQFCHDKLAVDRSSHGPALKSNFKADSENPLKRVTGTIFPSVVRFNGLELSASEFTPGWVVGVVV
jgi:hypothetical protein